MRLNISALPLMHYADFLFCVKFVHVFTRMNSEHAQNSRRLTWWPHECRLPLPIIGRLLPLREDYTSYWKFNGANIFILLLVIWKATVASVKSCRYDVLSCRAQLKSSYGWKLWPDLSLYKETKISRHISLCMKSRVSKLSTETGRYKLRSNRQSYTLMGTSRV